MLFSWQLRWFKRPQMYMEAIIFSFLKSKCRGFGAWYADIWGCRLCVFIAMSSKFFCISHPQFCRKMLCNLWWLFLLIWRRTWISKTEFGFQLGHSLFEVTVSILNAIKCVCACLINPYYTVNTWTLLLAQNSPRTWQQQMQEFCIFLPLQ